MRPIARSLRHAVVLLLCLAHTALAPIASAENRDNADADTGPMLFAGAGLSLDKSDYSDGITSRGINTDDRGPTFGLSLHAGIEPADWLSVSAGWRSLGLQRAENLNADFDLETTQTFVQLDLLAPVNDRFRLGATVGTAYWKVKETIEITSDIAFGASVSGNDPYYGIIGRVSQPGSSVSVDFFARRYVIKDNELADDLRFTSFGAALNIHF